MSDSSKVPKIVDALKETKTGKSLDNLTAFPLEFIYSLLAKPRKWIAAREMKIEKAIQEVAEKTKNIPRDQLEEPDVHIAVPALISLSYSMDSAELRNLYSNLLARAMIKDTKDSVHPAFVEIIKQLSPREAQLLNHLKPNEYYPIVNWVVTNDSSQGFTIIREHVMKIDKFKFEPDGSLLISNLLRLGLVAIPDNYSLSDDSLYDNLKEDVDFFNSGIKEFKAHIDGNPLIDSNPQIHLQKKILHLSPFGQSFVQVCVTD